MSSPWLRCLAERPKATRRMLLIPHAGGGPSYFRQWLSTIPEDFEPWAVQLPGREARFKEKPHTRIGPLLQELLPAVAALNNKPLSIIGHSLGALIAFELARRLPHNTQLIVSGAKSPMRSRRRSKLHLLTDAALHEELTRLGGTPASVLYNCELFELYLPTLRADLEVLETYEYQPGPFRPGPVRVIGGTTDPWANADELLAWSDVVAEPEVCMFPGGHFYLNDHRPWSVVAADMDVHVLDLTCPSDELVLNETERQRAARFLKPEHRLRFASARSAVRSIIGNTLQCRPIDVPIQTAMNGKPYLDPNPAGIHFNLSHTGEVGLLAVARHPLGIDIERHRDNVAGPDLARRYFSVAEFEDLQSRPEAERQARFFAYWSAKEAYIKARGLGLNIPLDQFDVQLGDGQQPAPVVDRHSPTENGRWHVYPINVREGYSAAIAAPPGMREFQLHRWPKEPS